MVLREGQIESGEKPLPYQILINFSIQVGKFINEQKALVRSTISCIINSHCSVHEYLQVLVIA